MDLSHSYTDESDEITLHRLTQAGIIPVTWYSTIKSLEIGQTMESDAEVLDLTSIY